VTVPPPAQIEELVRLVAAAPSGAERTPRLAALAARSRTGADAVMAFTLLQATPDGKRAALEFVAAMPEPVPSAVVLLAAQALHDQDTPLPVRMAAAGTLLASVPDNPPTVGPIVRAVTAGLSKSKILQRLIELQSRVEKCDTLDAMVTETSKAVKLRCPKCDGEFRRAGFIRHLWQAHRLQFDRGVAVDPRPQVEEAVTTATLAADPADVDRAFTLTEQLFPQSIPQQVLQAVAARQIASGYPVPDELTRSAADDHTGLCPNCLAPVVDPFATVPPPLAVTKSRLAGDGYSVEVIDSPAGRMLRVVTPKDEFTEKPQGERRFDPRVVGVFASAPALVVGLVLVFLPFVTQPFLAALGCALLAGLLYAAVAYTRQKLPDGQRLVVDAAWKMIVPEMKRSKANARWLTRLCRATADRGSPEDRARVLSDLVSDAADGFDRGTAFVQLFAAARMLQVADGASMGRERVMAILDVFEPFFKGELSAEYAEAAAEVAQSDDLIPGADSARLSVRLIATAFEAGFQPLDLLQVLRYLPHLRILCGRPSADLLKLQFQVWKWRSSEPWASVGPAVPLFELAESSPAACRRVLSAHPDAVLRIELPDAAERELGEVLMTARGLVVAGKVLSDPDEEAELIRSPRGSGWMLALGSQKINLDRKLPPEVVALLGKWLRYRVNRLLPHAESQDRRNGGLVRRVLGPLVRACGLCGTECVCRTGRVGDAWPVV
jgi:uncharacterized C2H2 Zn-finger protein